MEINWNIPDGALAETPEQAAAKLAADVAALERKSGGSQESPPANGKADSQESPPSNGGTGSQESPPIHPEHARVVYEVQAKYEAAYAKATERVTQALASIGDPTLRSCALGRALVVSRVDIDLALAAYNIEFTSTPQPGDRVMEENGSVGTVVSVLSLTEVVVKWDHLPRAMRSAVKHLSPTIEEK